MHEYKSNWMHYTSEEALMQWLEALKLVFQSWEQIMEHLVGGLQSQALGFRSLLSVKDVYLKSSTTSAFISCLAAGIPQHSNSFTAPRRYEITISVGDDDDGSLENWTTAISVRWSG